MSVKGFLATDADMLFSIFSKSRHSQFFKI